MITNADDNTIQFENDRTDFREIYEKASSELKALLINPILTQVFTGITPTLILGQRNNIQDDFCLGFDRETMIELYDLLENTSNFSIKLLKYSNLPNLEHGGYRMMIINHSAVKRVANQNPEYFINAGFTQSEIPNIVDELVKNPERWSMMNLSRSNDNQAIASEIISGLLSGYPLHSSIEFTKWSISGIDVKASMEQNTLILLYNPTLVPIPAELSLQSGLSFKCYSIQDLEYVKVAIRVKNLFLESLNI